MHFNWLRNKNNMGEQRRAMRTRRTTSVQGDFMTFVPTDPEKKRSRKYYDYRFCVSLSFFAALTTRGTTASRRSGGGVIII